MSFNNDNIKRLEELVKGYSRDAVQVPKTLARALIVRIRAAENVCDWDPIMSQDEFLRRKKVWRKAVED